MLDVAVKVVFLRELGREPLPFELDEFVLYSYERAQTLLRQTPEYIAKHDPLYKGEIYYHSGSHVVRVRTPLDCDSWSASAVAAANTSHT